MPSSTAAGYSTLPATRNRPGCVPAFCLVSDGRIAEKGVETRLTYMAQDLIQGRKAVRCNHKQGKVRTLQHLQERNEELTTILTEYCKSSMLRL